MIRERNGKLVVTAYAGRDLATGKRRSKSATVTGTTKRHWAMARRLEDRLREQLEADAVIEDPTVDELLDRWLETANHEASTAHQTMHDLKRYVRPRIGKARLSTITTARLDALYAELRKSGGVRKQGGPLAPGTVNRVHRHLHAAFEQARKWRWVTENPTEWTTPPRAPQPDPDPPPPSTVVEFVELIEEKDKRLATFLWLAAATGARRGEIAALRWCDLNLETGALHKRKAVKTGGAGTYVGDTKTSKRYVLSLGSKTVELLQAHHDRLEATAAACDVELVDEAYVFSLDPDGSAWADPMRITKQVEYWRRQFGKPVILKELRHFAATQMIAAGVDPVTGARRLGHARTSTFTDIYSGFLPASDIGAAAALEDVLGAARKVS